MTLFRRSGAPVDIPDPHAHELTLTHRLNDADREVARLAERSHQLLDEHSTSLLEGRFDDHSLAAMELEAINAQLAQARMEKTALETARLEVAKERQRIDMETRLTEFRALYESTREKITQMMADLPAMIAAAQALAQTALAEEEKLQQAYVDVHLTEHALQHWGEPQYSVPRRPLPRPVTTAFEQWPEYRALANKTWHVGLLGGPR